MKSFRIIVVLLLISALYQSCSSTFNPSAPYKNVTIVYGLLNLRDTVHYIKIEKAFLSEANGNAYTEAKVADSLYYPEGTINVSLEAFNNGTLENTIPLHRIRGDSIPVNLYKDTGLFATNPNIIYYTKAPLNATYNYELVINNTKTGQIISAQTNIVDSFLVSGPTRATKVSFDSRYYFDATWYPAANAQLYQLVIYFHYREININNPANYTDNTLMWTFPSDTTPYQDFPAKEFYTFVASEVPVNPSVERQALSFDFWIYAGGPQLYTYQQVSIAGSTSLVQGVTNPVYTNIKNGYGLFSSTILQQENNLEIKGATIDSLARSGVTQPLQFFDEYGKIYKP